MEGIIAERAAAVGGFELPFMDVYGPIVIGSFISCFLLAIFLAGAWHYFYTYTDSRYVRLVVFTLLILTTIDTCFTCSRVVKIMVLHPGDVLYFIMLRERFEDWVNPLISNLTSVLSQGFMAWRVIVLSRAMRVTRGKVHEVYVWILTVVLCIGVLLSLCFGIVAPIYLHKMQNYLEAYEHVGHGTAFSRVTDIQISSFVFLDIIITLAMTYELRLARTGFAGTNSILDVIMTTMLRNGFVVVILQVAQLILFHKSATAWADFPPIFLSKVYVITVLAILCRPRIAQQAYLAKMDQEAQPGVSALSDPNKLRSGTDTPVGGGSGGGGRKCHACGSIGYTSAITSLNAASSLYGPRTPNTENTYTMPRPLDVAVLRSAGAGSGDGIVGFKAALMEVDEEEGGQVLMVPNLNQTRHTDLGGAHQGAEEKEQNAI